MRFLLIILLLADCALAQGVLTRPYIARRYIAHGDSMTAKAYESSNYLDHVMELIGGPGGNAVYEPLSLGWSGTGFIHNYTNGASAVVTNMTATLTNVVTNLLTGVAVDARTQHHLIVFGGTNDRWLGNNTSNAIYTALTNYLHIATNAGFSTSRVWVVTSLPRQSFSESERTNLNAEIERAATNRNCQVVSVHTNALIGVAGQQNNATYFSDTIHLTVTGHRVLASNIVWRMQQ